MPQKGTELSTGHVWVDNNTITKPKPKPKPAGSAAEKPPLIRLTATPPEAPADLKAYLEAHIHKAHEAMPSEQLKLLPSSNDLIKTGTTNNYGVPLDSSIRAMRPEDYGRQPGTQSAVDMALGMGSIMPENIAPAGFFSKLGQVLDSNKQGIWTSEQLKGFLKKQGVTDAELKWTGMQDLMDRNTKITRQGIAETLRSAPGVELKELGALAKTPPDLTRRLEEADANLAAADPNAPDERYFQLRAIRDGIMDEVDAHMGTLAPSYDRDSLKLPGPHDNYREVLFKHKPAVGEGPAFRGSHWDEDNVLAHLRLTDRFTPHTSAHVGDTSEFATGGHEKVSLAEEHQSDWAAAHRKEFEEWAKSTNNIGGIPPRPAAPYIEGSWPDLTVKHHLLEAARDPKTRWVGWTTGEQQISRYEQALRSVADDIRFHPDQLPPTQSNPNEIGLIPPDRSTSGARFQLFKNGQALTLPQSMKPPESWEDVEKLIGPELTAKLKANAGPHDIPGAMKWGIAKNGKPLPAYGFESELEANRFFRAAFQNEWNNPDSVYSIVQVPTKETIHGHRITADAGDFRIQAKWPTSLYDENLKSRYQKWSGGKAVKLPIQGEAPKYAGELTVRYNPATSTWGIIAPGTTLPLARYNSQDEAMQALYTKFRPKANSTQDVWAVPMTPTLRQKLLKDGLPLYATLPFMTLPGPPRKNDNQAPAGGPPGFARATKGR